MEFREHAWNQQLFHMRLLHGAGAEITERSLPNYPGVALREVLKQSQHPHNLEPLLLTLCRPPNAATRQRFAGAQGELVLIEKALSKDPIATDLQVAMHGQIVQAAEGILYPTQDVTTSFEVWLRLEMLDALATMISEGVVRSLVPEMQQKLLHDLLDITGDKDQHELVRLYAFVTAVQAAKCFQGIRAAAAADPAFLSCALAYLTLVTSTHSSCSIFIDPAEHMRALNACIEAIYLAALGGPQDGDPSLRTTTTGTTTTHQLEPLQLSAAMQDPETAASIAKALQQTCLLLSSSQQRMAAAAVAAAAKRAKKQQQQQQQQAAEEEGGKEASGSKQELSPELQEQLDAIPDSFESNWQQYLDYVDARGTLAALGSATAALAAALLQLVTTQVDGTSSSWQHLTAEALQQLANSQQPLLQSIAAISAAAAGCSLQPSPTPAAAPPEVAAGTAIVSLPGYGDLVQQVYARHCSACSKREEAAGKLKKCGQCGKAWYCSVACQKADWRMGHKGVCKELAGQA